MNVLIVGTGVMGIVYGWALTDAGVPVTHCVHPRKANLPLDQLALDVLDLRPGYPEHSAANYQPRIVSNDQLADDYDLLIVPTNQYQAGPAIAELQDRVRSAKILMFCGNWTGPQEIDAVIPRSRYVWGYAASTGGATGNSVTANIRSAYRLGALEGSSEDLLHQVVELFELAGFTPDLKDNIVEWLWTHHAINAGMIGTALAAGGIAEMGESDERMQQMVHAVRDSLAVLAARGVDLSTQSDTAPYLSTEINKTIDQVRQAFLSGEWGERVIASGHFKTSPDEMKGFFRDVLTTGRQLDVPTPTLEKLNAELRAL
jgi:2-dehydropantoate 2-reductase